MSEKRLLTQIRDATRREDRGQYYNRALTLNGSGVTHSMLGGASGVTELFMTASLDSPFLVHRMISTVVDGPGFDAGDYGAITGGVANGLRLCVLDSNNALVYELTDPLLPIQKNVDWASYCFDSRLDSYGTGNNYLSSRWTFSKSGRPILLPTGHKLSVMSQDSFSDLAGHHFIVQGYTIPYVTPTLGKLTDVP
jgi:hypothetical protein